MTNAEDDQTDPWERRMGDFAALSLTAPGPLCYSTHDEEDEYRCDVPVCWVCKRGVTGDK